MIDADGNQAGIMNVRDAIRLAESRGLDLVEVASTAQPPVCRVTDFDKYRYSQKKKSHDVQASRHRQRDQGSQDGRADREARRRVQGASTSGALLGEGQRVKLSVSFRGRQITHPELGRTLTRRILEQVQDIAQPDGSTRMEGRNMSVLLTPR